jgi:diguanylate cyclase (GGDEF)-like protein/PAS domain S-box-containing protein
MDKKTFRTILEASPIGYAEHKILCDSSGKPVDYEFLDINPAFEKLTGLKREDIIGRRVTQVLPGTGEGEFDWIGTYGAVALGGESLDFEEFSKVIGRHYSVWVFSERPYHFTTLFSNITKFVEIVDSAERQLRAILSNLPGVAYRCLFNEELEMEYISDGCYALTGYLPEELLHNPDKSFNDLMDTDEPRAMFDQWRRSILEQGFYLVEYGIHTKDGVHKWVYERGQAIYDKDGNIEGLEGLIIDITDLRMKEEKIHYLSRHDALTGLYNRIHYEAERERISDESFLPLSFIIIDINGLKLINETLGYSQGNRLITETAALIQKCIHSEDVLARTGGDEFSIFLPHTDAVGAEVVANRILTACEEWNHTIPSGEPVVQISLGFATRSDATQHIDEIEKNAEDAMYKRKLLDRNSAHSNLLASIKTTMYERSRETEEHAERLAAMCRSVGEKFGLSKVELDELELLAVLHDLGKIGIPNSILDKPGPLTPDEWDQMKQHPEIGYRIAGSSPELTSISAYILAHHERWDGSGYPKGLKGEEIPLLSRILSVADAFDAMTSERPYGSVKSKEEALREIHRYSGSQFDPSVTAVFLEIVDDILMEEED